MPKGREETDTVEDFAKTYDGNARCRTCVLSEVLLEDCRKYLQMKTDGTMKHGIPAFRDWLHRKYGYEPKAGALREHMKNCEPELYARSRNRA